MGGDRRQAQFFDDLALGSTQVAGQNDARPTLTQKLNRGDGGPDPGVVGDAAVLEGDVEVDTNEDTPVGHLGGANRTFGHGGAPCLRMGRE